MGVGTSALASVSVLALPASFGLTSVLLSLWRDAPRERGGGALPPWVPELVTGTHVRGLLCTVDRNSERGLVHVAPGSVLAHLAREPLMQDEKQLLDKLGRAHAQRNAPQEVEVRSEVDARGVLHEALKVCEGTDAEVGG